VLQGVEPDPVRSPRRRVKTARQSRSALIGGHRYGSLVVLEPAERDANGHTRWLCRCDCGELTTARTNNLRSGRTRSCGCEQIKAHLRNLAAWNRRGQVTP
jgi:hypothetical protein